MARKIARKNFYPRLLKKSAAGYATSITFLNFGREGLNSVDGVELIIFGQQFWKDVYFKKRLLITMGLG